MPNSKLEMEIMNDPQAGKEREHNAAGREDLMGSQAKGKGVQFLPETRLRAQG